MKISIITATYNSESTILDTIESLNNQTHHDIEHIVIDGGSTDNTVETIKKYGRRVTILISEKDNGIYDALNKGIKLANGEVIGFLHSDDIFSNQNIINKICNEFSSDLVDALYGDLHYVDSVDPNKIIRKWISSDFDKKKIKYGWMPPHPTFFMRRALYKKFGFFSINYKIASDYESLLRYLWRNDINVKYLPIVITKMRVGGISNRSISSIITKMKEDIEIMKKNGIFWPIALAGKNILKVSQFIVGDE